MSWAAPAASKLHKRSREPEIPQPIMSNVPAVSNSAEFSDFTKIRKQLFINSGLLGLSRILSTCTSLVTVPVVLSKLGLDGYGSWEAMMAIAALVMVFQTTINGTLVWKMSGAYGNGDLLGIRRLMGVGIGAVLCMFAVVTPFVWTVRFQLVGLSNIPPLYRGAAVWVIPILVSQTTVGALGETFAAVLIAHQRAGITTLIQTAALMANSGFVIIGLLHGWHLWSLLLGNTVGVVLGIAGQYVAVVKICQISSLWPCLPSWDEARPLLGFAGFLALGQISIALRDSTDKFVLASVGNTVWTAWFGLASRLANLTLMVCSFFYVPLVSAVAALAARRDWAGVRRIYANTMILMPFLAGSFVVLVASTYDRLLKIWIGQSIPQVGPILFILLTGNITAIVLTGVGSSLCKGIGKVSIETTYIVICVVANVVLKLTLTPWLGPIGSVLSSAGSWILGSIVFVILLHRAVELPNTAIRAAAMIPMMFVTVMITRGLTGFVPPSTTRWNAAMAASGIGLFSIALFSTLLVATRILPWATLRRAGEVLRASALARLGVRYAI
jgi:O-antigen/teichoic acid export membrane protein